MPPILIDLARRRPLFPKPAFTWDGIYPHLKNVPTENGTYDNDARKVEFLHRTGSALRLVRCGKKPDTGWQHQLLAFLVAAISPRCSTITILDVGGGLGIGYVELLARLRLTSNLTYHVVELAGMCAAGKELFADDLAINFHNSLALPNENIDIVYLSGVLPYIEDYCALLKQLAGFSATYLLLTQLAAGGFPTYAARQLNLPNQVLPYWFLNLDEIIEVVSKAGYSLIYEGQGGPEYDQSNYPESYRIGKMRNLLFVRH